MVAFRSAKGDTHKGAALDYSGTAFQPHAASIDTPPFVSHVTIEKSCPASISPSPRMRGAMIMRFPLLPNDRLPGAKRPNHLEFRGLARHRQHARLGSPETRL